MGDLGAGPSSGGKESLEKPNLLLSPRRKINHSPITPGEKIIALNMYKSLYKSSETYPEKTLIVKQVAEFMGTCEKTIRRIISEKRKSAVSDMESGAGPSSCKKRPQLPEPPNFLLSPIKKVKRRSFTSREKILALNMYKYLYKSSETYPEPDKTLIVKQVAEIMGTSQSALRRIISERRKSAVPEIETGAGPSSGKKRPRSPEPPNFLLTPIKKVKRKTFTSREKIIAINMYKYFYKSSKTYPDKTVTVKQVAEVMGTSQSIIRRIISEKSS